MAHPQNVRLRIDLAPMPTVWCSGVGNLSVGLQSGKSDIVRGIPTEGGVRFDVEVRVKVGKDGGPDFGGPLVHGRVGDRFLYLSWGEVTAKSDHQMFRRLKLYLSPVARKGWSSPGIAWEQIERGEPLVVSVSGADGCDGSPSCGTVPIRWR